jgi:hypothetical protein
MVTRRSAKEQVMVKREQVSTERGRRWVSGRLPSEEYFRGARKIAREQAEQDVLARIEQARRPFLAR